MKLSRYTKLGILITVSIAIFIWGMNYLKGIDFFKNNTTFYAVYPRVDGLVRSSIVTLNGYQVGQVKDIEFSGRNDGSLLVSFTLEGDSRLPKGTVARIISSDIMGTRSIKLEIAASNEYYQENDTIPGTIEGDLKEQVSMQVLPLKNKAEQLLSSLDSAITVVTYIFNEETRENLSESFEHINQTIMNIRETSSMLNKLMENQYTNIEGTLVNLKQITDTLNESSGHFRNIIANASNISDSIAGINVKQLFTDVSQSADGINQIIQKINANEGTAGRLINDAELYSNLAQLSQSLDDLLNDLRRNPKRYVHFSAFDLGKEIYITTRKPADEKASAYSYKVNLVSSPSRINTENPLFKEFQPIEEIQISGIYNYFTGETFDFNVASKLNDQAKKVFPDASIVAFRKGRPVRLEKALKELEN
jgi:phospholipid/cholesterol/gamma-HCH transport system substrate-binding protein